MKNIVLIDGNPMMWRAAHSRGVHNVTEYILKYFFDIVEKFRGYDVLVFWDEGKSQWRSNYYPEYKAQREEVKKQFDLKEMKRQKDDAIKYLEYFGVRNIVVPGIEADDLIGVMSEYFSKVLMFDTTVIASRDRDLWQLVTDTVLVYDPYSNELINKDSVVDRFGVEPDKVSQVKALSGDSSDNIKGVHGVGDNKAVGFLEKFGDIEGLMSLDNVKDMKKQKVSERILHNSEDMEISYQLVLLPKLYNVSYYFTDLEMSTLKSSCLSVLKKDMMLARTEADLLSLPMPPTADGFYGFEQEMVQFVKDWLNPYRIDPEISMKDLDRSISTCKRCFKSLEGCTGSPPDGLTGSDFMVVARSSLKDRELITRLLDALEIAPERVWWTSVSKCEGVKPLTYGQMKCCSDFLRAEVNLIKPKMIFSLGIEAMSVLTELRGKASDHCGEIIHKPSGMIGEVDSYVSMLIDPDLALRSEQRKVDWVFGSQKIMEFFRNKREGK